MKRTTAIGIIPVSVCLLLFACTDEKRTVQQQGTTMVDSVKTAKKVERKVDLPDVQRSLQEDSAANGRYSADLNEVTAFNGIVSESDKYDADPAAGTVTEQQ